MMKASRYNLRSNRRECSIPVQLQLATDKEFVTASRGHMESAQAEQVFSELSDSESDIDLIRHLDQNLSPVVSSRQSVFAAGGTDSVPGTLGLNSSISEQAAINPKKLQQLNTLGQWLDSI